MCNPILLAKLHRWFKKYPVEFFKYSNALLDRVYALNALTTKLKISGLTNTVVITYRSPIDEGSRSISITEFVKGLNKYIKL